MSYTSFFIISILNIIVMTAGFFPFIDTLTPGEALATGCTVNFLTVCFLQLAYDNWPKKRRTQARYTR